MFAYALLRGDRHGARVTVGLFAVAAPRKSASLRSRVGPFDAAQVDTDATSARLGLTLPTFTRRGASIAISSVGATAYFAHRPAVDIFDTMDPVIAREPIHPVGTSSAGT